MGDLEADIEQEACDRILGELGVVNVKLNIHGNNGWPDRMFLILGGRPFFIEFKQPGEKPRPRQVYVHRLLKLLQYRIEVCTSADQAFQLIKKEVDSLGVPNKSREVPT